MTSLLLIAVVGQSCIAQQTYAAPVQYQQTYNQAYVQNAYVEKTIFVAVEAQDAPAYYGGLVAQQQRAAERQAQAQQVQSTADQKIDQLTRLVLDLQKRLETQQNEPPIPSKPATPAAEPPRPSLPALAPALSEAVPPPPTVAQASSNITHAGATVLSRHCADCHGKNGTRKGGRQFFDRSGRVLEADAVALSAMRDAILAGTMPPQDRKPLTLREFASINELVNQQASGLALTPAGKRGKRS